MIDVAEEKRKIYSLLFDNWKKGVTSRRRSKARDMAMFETGGAEAEVHHVDHPGPPPIIWMMRFPGAPVGWDATWWPTQESGR